MHKSHHYSSHWMAELKIGISERWFRIKTIIFFYFRGLPSRPQPSACWCLLSANNELKCIQRSAAAAATASAAPRGKGAASAGSRSVSCTSWVSRYQTFFIKRWGKSSVTKGIRAKKCSAKSKWMEEIVFERIKDTTIVSRCWSSASSSASSSSQQHRRRDR